MLFFALVTALGAGTRFYRARIDAAARPATGQSQIVAQLSAVDSAIAGRQGGKKGKGKRKRGGAVAADTVPSIVDIDRATAAEIETLRGIGPKLAARIVADRDSFGAFGSIEGLRRVRGIGPALAERVAAHVTFSGVPRPVNTVTARRSERLTVRRKPRQKD